MFTNILFLILALLIINSPGEEITPWITSPWLAFSMSILLFLGLCTLILIQYFFLKDLFRKRPSVIQLIVSIELLLYLIIYQYILDTGRIFQLIPYLQNAQAINSIWELCLYLGGLGVYYSASFIRLYTYGKIEQRSTYVWRQLRFLLPFTVPFILITVILDVIGLFNITEADSKLMEGAFLLFGVIIIILLLIFLPYFIQKIWLCKSLPNSELKNRLTKLCQKAQFKHAGMKTWSIMHDQLTAGIIGVVPRFRYVMFTDRLLKELSPESIEAILAHEIGHNAHKHLLIYPVILAGMMVWVSLFFYFLGKPLSNFLEQENALHPSIWWDLFNPLIIFSLYAGIIIIYFRFIFGYFSRLFERQADLHIFELDIPPQHMIQALEAVAYTSGGYDTPNWHHYSIKQRIEFLQACMTNPLLIQRCHRKVKIVLVVYFTLFILLSSFLIYLS